MILAKIIISIFPWRSYLNLNCEIRVRGRNFYAVHIGSPQSVVYDDMTSIQNIWIKILVKINIWTLPLAFRFVHIRHIYVFLGAWGVWEYNLSFTKLSNGVS